MACHGDGCRYAPDNNEYKIKNDINGWMDGWTAMETDTGRAVMKTPATKALFNVVMPTPVTTTLSISRAVDNHLATKYSK